MKFISDNPSKQKQEIMVMMLLFLCFLYIGCNAGNLCNKHIPKNKQKKLPTNMKTKNVNSMETQLLQTLGKNTVNTIFDFLNPKDFLAASNKFLSETQKNQCSNKFKTKNHRSKLPIQYPVIEYIPDINGTHCLPLNVKQMFTFETSFYSVKESIGPNLASLTLFHDGDQEIYFDGSIKWNPHKKHFNSIDSLKFYDNTLLALNRESSYSFEIRFLEVPKVPQKIESQKRYQIDTRYIKNVKNSFSGKMKVFEEKHYKKHY